MQTLAEDVWLTAKAISRESPWMARRRARTADCQKLTAHQLGATAGSLELQTIFQLHQHRAIDAGNGGQVIHARKFLLLTPRQNGRDRFRAGLERGVPVLLPARCSHSPPSDCARNSGRSGRPDRRSDWRRAGPSVRIPAPSGRTSAAWRGTGWTYGMPCTPPGPPESPAGLSSRVDAALMAAASLAGSIAGGVGTCASATPALHAWPSAQGKEKPGCPSATGRSNQLENTFYLLASLVGIFSAATRAAKAAGSPMAN